MFEVNSEDGSSPENENESDLERIGVDSTDHGPAGSSGWFSKAESLHQKRMDFDDISVWLTGLKATQFSFDDPHDLCSGHAFSEILHKIDPNFFDFTWKSKISSNTSNIVVKKSNLRRLWRKIADYLTTQQNRQVSIGCRWSEIDERIEGTEETDLPVAVDFGMLVITIAHIGPTQQFFVDYSKSMSAEHPREIENVAKMISLVLSELPEASNYLEVSNLDETVDEAEEISIYESQSERRASDPLEIQHEAHRKEKKRLEKEVERLTKALEAALLNTSVSSDSNDLSLLEKQNEELRVKRREADERALELEAQIELHRKYLEELTAENDSLKACQKELHSLRSDFISAKDEAVEWRAKAQHFSSQAELAKNGEKKEIYELQRQVKFLNARLQDQSKHSKTGEDSNSSRLKLLKENGTLTAMNQTLVVKVASSERQLAELENKLIEYKERVNHLEEQRDELTEERKTLKQQLKHKDAFTSRSLHESMFESGHLLFEPFSEEEKKSMESENIQLREQIAQLKSLEPLKNEIVTVKSRISVLEEENELLTRQNDELNREKQEVQERNESGQKALMDDYNELTVRLEKNHEELQRLHEAENISKDRVVQLEALLEECTSELEHAKERLQKALSVIDEQKTNDTRASAGIDSEHINTLLSPRKTSGVLSWSLFVILLLLLFVFVFSNLYSVINAPPIA